MNIADEILHSSGHPRQAAPAEARLAAVPRWAGLIYIALLPLNIELKSPLFVHDLLVPVFAAAVLSRGNFKRYLHGPLLLLSLFLCGAALSTILHLKGTVDIYELAIFCYMGLLFLYYSRTELPPKWLFGIAVATLAAFCAWAAGETLLGSRAVYDVYRGSELDFIAKRFFFTFSHPNLLGSFYVLPVLCILLKWNNDLKDTPTVPPDLRSTPSQAGDDLSVNTPTLNDRTPQTWRLALLALLCVPLAMTVSRHMLLTFAVVAGFLVARCPQDADARPYLRIAAGVVLLSVFALFYLTILFPFFPIKNQFPFLNCETLGMYTVHQEIYLKMIFLKPWYFLVGLGRTGVIQTYPALADYDSIHAILAQYGQAFLTKSFATYMDAHNEYLNLSASFGVPVMLCCYSFWAGSLRLVPKRTRGRSMLVFYVIAVIFVSFWDDILSKRWMWIALGICVNQLSGPGQAGRHSNTFDAG